jgi:hypothetical protein
MSCSRDGMNGELILVEGKLVVVTVLNPGKGISRVKYIM